MEFGGEQPIETKTRWSDKIQRDEKWEFYSIASEEIMTYLDNEENKNF